MPEEGEAAGVVSTGDGKAKKRGEAAGAASEEATVRTKSCWTWDPDEG